MSKSDKAKTAGKFVVIMLCFAILFFLLLPLSGFKGEYLRAFSVIFARDPRAGQAIPYHTTSTY